MKTLTLVCAAIALTFAGNANAQDCGCGTSYGNFATVGSNNCGREISTNDAAALWSGYCTEDCTIHKSSGCGSGCGLFSKLRGRGLGSGGCNTGGCGAGCGAGMANFGGFNGFSGLRNRGCGCKSGCGGGLGLFAKLQAKMASLGCRSKRCGGRTGCSLFSKFRGGNSVYGQAVVSTVDQCGCGNSGQYFEYSVGAEYGNAGMQSAVAGSLTGACCGGVPQNNGMMHAAPAVVAPQHIQGTVTQ